MLDIISSLLLIIKKNSYLYPWQQRSLEYSSFLFNFCIAFWFFPPEKTYCFCSSRIAISFSAKLIFLVLLSQNILTQVPNWNKYELLEENHKGFFFQLKKKQISLPHYLIMRLMLQEKTSTIKHKINSSWTKFFRFFKGRNNE